MTSIRNYVREVKRCLKKSPPRLRQTFQATRVERCLERLRFASFAHREVLHRERLFRESVYPFSDHELATGSIFIHVPKAAGNSICSAIYGASHGLGHDKAIRYREVDSSLFRDSFKFAFVRNPFDRLVSAFHYLRGKPQGWNDKSFCKQYLSHYASFAEFSLNLQDDEVWDSISQWTHFTPQYEFVCDQDGQLIVDWVGRFESLEQDLSHVARTMNRPLDLVEKRNATPRARAEDYFNRESREIVADRYRGDFERFEYSSTDRASALKKTA